MLHLGQNIRELRTGQGMSQEQLAYDLGVSSQTISRWENGVTYPDVTLLPILAEHFEVTIDRLMGYQKECARDVRETFFREMQGRSPQECIGRVREMLQTYPNDVYLQFSLVGLLYGQLKKEYSAEKEREIQRLCHAIRESGVPGMQCGAIRVLALLAAGQGDTEKAMAYVNELPSLLGGREIVAEMVLHGTSFKSALMAYVQQL